MIKVKHLMDAVEGDDGARLWVEPIGLTRDLREWCAVSESLCHLGPPTDLWRWLEDHPDGYDFFRATYHEWLARSRYKPALMKLARAAMTENVTLLHQGDDPQRNTAAALWEFLSELSSYCRPDSPDE